MTKFYKISNIEHHSSFNKDKDKLYYESFNLDYKTRERYEREIGYRYALEEYDDEFYIDKRDCSESTNTEEQLALLKSILPKLTSRQRKIYDLILEGYTETGIAKKLNTKFINIHKSIFGNYDLKRKKHYGGLLTKIKTLMEEKQFETDIKSDIKSGNFTADQICDKYGLKRKYIYKFYNKYGVKIDRKKRKDKPPEPPKPLSEKKQWINKIKSDIKLGLSTKELLNKYKIKRSLLTYYRMRLRKNK